jgi:uncharacterized peroxidase-related enzyme
MSRINIPAVETASGATADVYARIKKAAGKVPNTYAAIGALAPAALNVVLAADDVLAAGTLSRQDQETIKLLVSEIVGCDYCVAAHSLLGKIAGLQLDTLKRIRAGEPTGDARRDALTQFVRTLLETRGTISQEAYSAIKAAGYTDAQLVEVALAIVIVSFTNLLFNRLNDTDIDFPRAA